MRNIFFLHHSREFINQKGLNQFNLGHQAFEWRKMEKCHFLAENLLGMSKWAEYLYVYEKYLAPGGCS